MKCQSCSSERVLEIGGKCSDLCHYSLKGQQSGDYSYVPGDMGIGGGDYLRINLCLDCGQTQGKWPCPKTDFESVIEERENAPFKRGDFVEFDLRGMTYVGEVDEYDMESMEVNVNVHGVWNEDTNRLGPVPPRPGPKSFSKIYTVDESEVTKTTKEW